MRGLLLLTSHIVALALGEWILFLKKPVEID